MFAVTKHNPADLFRLAWAQERLERLREKSPDINSTGKKPIIERECLSLQGVDQMSLREAVQCMQSRIRTELERN